MIYFLLQSIQFIKKYDSLFKKIFFLQKSRKIKNILKNKFCYILYITVKQSRFDRNKLIQTSFLISKTQIICPIKQYNIEQQLLIFSKKTYIFYQQQKKYFEYYQVYLQQFPYSTMQLTLPQLDFTVSLNACYDEVMNKMQVLTNMQIQLLRKFEHQLSNSQMHYQMIHDVRVMIVNLQEVYKDVKQYFNQMNIQFVYDFFRKIQVLMVCGYNFLSQALLASVDKYQDKKNKQVEKQKFLNCKVCKCTCPQSIKNKKREIREVQQYDFKISILQNEQQKLASQIQSIYQKMMMQKSMIQKTKPSLAVRQLQDMKQHIQNYILRNIYDEIRLIQELFNPNKKPQDLADYFISNMNFNMKDKFLKAMQKAIYKAQHMQHKLQKSHVKDIQTQTQKIKQLSNIPMNNDRQSLNYRGFSSLKPQKNQNLLTKQRKHNEKIVTQIQFLRKQLNNLMSQNEKMKKQVQLKQVQRLQHKQNYDTLQNLYSKRTFQLQNAQNQNKWLVTQKQSQTKKLKLQIKQLKKDQVETHHQYIQTFIPPNYQNKSTQTQIIYFQNQIDNQIINVLKKNNDKMILKLNQKQRKIRDLKVSKEQIDKFKQSKIICVGFLEDLRQVTTYKLKQNNNKEGQYKNRKQEQLVSNRQPIVPLNQNTTNQSIVKIIDKLTQDIKILLFTQSLTTKRIHTVQKQKRSSTFKNKTLNSTFKNQIQGILQKSQDSVKNIEGFFKNSKRNSTISLNKQIFQDTITKQSIYKKQYDERSSTYSKDQSNHSHNKITKDNDFNHQTNKNQQKLSKYSSQNKITLQKNSNDSNNLYQDQRKKSCIQMSNISQFGNQKQNIIQRQKRKRKSKFNIYKESKQKNKRQYQQKNQIKKQQHSYCEYSQQTDFSLVDIKELQQNSLNLKNNYMIDPSKMKTQPKNLKKQSYQSYMNKKHPYVRKPVGGRINLRGHQSQRINVFVNNSLPINETQMSQFTYQNLNNISEEHNSNKIGNLSNSYLYKNISHDNLYPMQGRQSNITLQSRLSTLMNPKSNRVSSNSGLIVFKKSSQDYQKRSSQMVFDGLGLDKNSSKDNQKRNYSFNSYRNDSLLVGTQKKESMISNFHDLTNSDIYKQNIHSIRQVIPMKSIFVQKIIEEDQNTAKLSKTNSNYQPLIQVYKKTPIQRQKNSPQRVSRQLPQNIFTRTVKQMILTTQTKQSLLKKIQQIYAGMQKQKQKKKLKKIIKNNYTPRNSDQRKSDKKKENINISMRLGDILY